MARVSLSDAILGLCLGTIEVKRPQERDEPLLDTTKCSVCLRQFYGQLRRESGHSWCERCASEFDRLDFSR